MCLKKYLKILLEVAFCLTAVAAVVFNDMRILNYDLIIVSLEGLMYFFENKSSSKVKASLGLILFVASLIIFFIFL